MDALRQSGAVIRRLIICLAIPVAIVVLLVGGRSAVRLKYERARASWKAAALPRLAALSLTNEEIRQELDTLKAGPTPNIDFRWAHEHVLLMTNGEYLIYASRHGFNSGFVDHLFLAHGSDGRWWYSTYHFCNSMAGVIGEDPPGSISEFAKKYAVREFDGKSDECLQHTWPVKE
jgi:hypothetical protein